MVVLLSIALSGLGCTFVTDDEWKARTAGLDGSAGGGDDSGSGGADDSEGSGSDSDSVDSGDSGDSGIVDSGDSGDSGTVDSGDSAGDSGDDTGPGPVVVDDDGDGWSPEDGDCDDADASLHPGAAETCDGIDEDCDGTADDGLATTSWYRDADGDGYGDPALSVASCATPTGYVANDDDCDDTDAGVSPSDREICDAVDLDEDCDGAADDDDSSVTGRSTWYLDDDGDGYGDSSTSLNRCDEPTGYAANGDDCDDADAGISPAETEVCDSANTDEDCDRAADDSDPDGAAGRTAYYTDADGDGSGAGASVGSYCDGAAGRVTNTNDCDDSSGSDHPGATEVAGNGDDEDCDGAETCYDDDDDDGYLDASGDTRASSDADCSDAYEGLSSDPTTDCDDASASRSPGNIEVCDASDTDDDCDGSADDADSGGASGCTTYYRDDDVDGLGDGTDRDCLCEATATYSTTDGSDCDDACYACTEGSTSASSDGGTAGYDDDCDGLIDEDDVATGDLVINEIMAKPRSPGIEWFEVANVSTTSTLYLAGWHFVDGDGDEFCVSSDAAVSVAPGDLALFCDADDSLYLWGGSGTEIACDYYFGSNAWTDFDGDGGTCSAASTSFDLDDSGDRLTAALDTTRYDMVTYVISASYGRSLELDPTYQDADANDDMSNWCEGNDRFYSPSATSTTHYGTPGDANTGC